jgi:gliding motility-associated-like protein
MRKLLIFILSAGCFFSAKADHITGGEMYYTFSGITNGNYIYNATLKLFMRCNSGRAFNDPTIISIFDRGTGSRVIDLSIPLSSQETLNYTNTNPCITNPPTVCYVVGYFNFVISLPASVNGYIIASQVNYRIAGINNLASNYGLIGATYTAEIPGTAEIAEAPKNSSAHFTGSDLVIVCADNSFSYSFAANDNDGDKLRYSFCSAYMGGPGGSPGSAVPPSAPPYPPVPYGFPDYSSSFPLGNNVHINAATGLITGIAPPEGKYVVTVCVEEVRNGIVIATQRKDLQINIASCSIAAATLLPQYTLCRNTKTISISNLSTSPLINTYNWQFINTAGAIIFTSAATAVSYTFPDTGTYIIKLFINQGQQCSDSTTSVAKVYPGFIPDFSFSGICVIKPTQFTDATTSVYGIVNSWNWDFGESLSNNNFSSEQNPGYTYTSQGPKNIRLIATDSKGCIDTVFKTITIVDKPPIALAFKDTLICIPDKVQLQASGSGNFSWTPLVNIINVNTGTPTVSPAVTTTYYVNLDEEGCKNRDSVKVRVVDHVSLQVMADTVICKSDSIQLRIVSDGLHYLWTPASQFIDPAIANPVAITNATTLYKVTAIIGSCSAKDQINVVTVPYPLVNAGADTLICFHTTAQLNGSTNGSSFIWAPAGALSNAAILNPFAAPGLTTTYILFAYDTKGCPKPGRDTVLVTVLPDINAFAGNDTSIVVNQPLQLHATGGIKYMWSPFNDLSDNAIANPVVIIKEPATRIQYKLLAYNEANCVDSAFINIKVYKTRPSVFVPNAFTPNGDRKNDLLRPIAVGIQRIEYFNVYNRWGQLVFSSNGNAESGGWNGLSGGKEQASGTFVWIVKAIDYTGATYSQKGIVLLIR